MNQTTEDSKQYNIIVGGSTTPNETGKITIPPKGKGAIDTTKIVEDLLNGINIQEIIVTDNNKEHENIMKNLDGYKENRENRKTENAIKRNNRSKTKISYKQKKRCETMEKLRKNIEQGKKFLIILRSTMDNSCHSTCFAYSL